jgi:hypothetical protein
VAARAVRTAAQEREQAALGRLGHAGGLLVRVM